MSNFAAADLFDTYVQTMSTRVDLATTKTIKTFVTVSDAVFIYANTIKVWGSCVLSDSSQFIQDVADEACANVQQLMVYASFYRWSSVFTIDTIITIADPFVFNSIMRASWLPTLAAPVYDFNGCLRLVLSVIQPVLCEFKGQGLTEFDPSNTHDVHQQNVIHMEFRDNDNANVDWVTANDIDFEVLPDCVSVELVLTFNITQDGNIWRIEYCVNGAIMGVHVGFSIKIANVTIREFWAQVWQSSMCCYNLRCINNIFVYRQ